MILTCLGGLGYGDIFIRGDEPGEMGDNLSTINLGTGRTATAIYAGDQVACALLDNGDFKCWGHNDYGQVILLDYESSLIIFLPNLSWDKEMW